MSHGSIAEANALLFSPHVALPIFTAFFYEHSARTRKDFDSFPTLAKLFPFATYVSFLIASTMRPLFFFFNLGSRFAFHAFPPF